MATDDEREDGWIEPEDAKTARQLIHYAGVGVRIYLWLFKVAAWILGIIVVLVLATDPWWYR